MENNNNNNNYIEGKSQKRRPKLTWEESIQNDPKKLSLTLRKAHGEREFIWPTSSM